jgi:hypothetical protein
MRTLQGNQELADLREMGVDRNEEEGKFNERSLPWLTATRVQVYAKRTRQIMADCIIWSTPPSRLGTHLLMDVDEQL